MSAVNSAQISPQNRNLDMYDDLLQKKLHRKVPGIVRGGCEEKTNCDWIDLKSRESLFYPSKDLLEEVKKYSKKYIEIPWIEDKILLKRQFQLLLQ